MRQHLLQLVMIGAFGAFGAVSRYSISGWMHGLIDTRFPIGTLTVNVVGCFLLGMLKHVGETTVLVSPEMRAALGVGFLGALTTFSTFGYETISQIEDGAWSVAMANIGVNVVVGILAVWGGLTLARVWLGGA